MALETFKIILDKVPFAKKIELFKNGEPFLNRDIFAMINLASQRRIKTAISTNFSFRKPAEFFENLVKSGLDKLIVSLDGASQESYSKYRKGGDFDLVIHNINKLVETKEKFRTRKPVVVWQFLVNRFNEHEISTAQRMAKELNVTLDLQPMGLADDLPDVSVEQPIQDRKRNWLPINKQYISSCYQGEYRFPLFQGICTQLFTRLTVAADGKVLPCCWAEDKSSTFGDLLTDGIDEIWYSQKFIDARSRFLKENFTPEVRSVCFRCNNYGVTLSLKDKLNLVKTVLRGLYPH
jgi:MoaA/NifB/PqqE/SkfB family radical SAM enzyme